MKILLDTANIETIEKILPYFPIDGFTTNPSILAKESCDVKDTLVKLRELAGKDRTVHAQVTAVHADEMLEQAKKLKDFIGDNFYAKIPITLEGLRAIPLCKAAGINCTVTAIFTPMQALTAGLAGADYVAPYVDRLDNITSHGVYVVKEIADLFKIYNLKTQVLAASFKNVQQIYEVASTGVHAVTINGELCMKLLFHPYTDKSLEDFASDWKHKFGDVEITSFWG
jgi:fructose-6-phosphate aldolase 2